MSDDEKTTELPVKIDVAAKAEVKLDVSAEIPTDSMGRLTDAITDIIRPFSEARGLKADLIRLQREEIAIEIIKLAHQRIDEQGLSIKPVPNKVLIPILEKASLEETDSTLIEAWANLLASASVNYDIEVNTFSEILSAIGPREADIIKEMLGTNDLSQWEDRHARATASSAFQLYNKGEVIKPRILKAIDEQDQNIFVELLEYFPSDYPVLVTIIGKGVATERANKIDTIFEKKFFTDNARGFVILERQGLIKESYAGFGWDGKISDDGPSGVNWYEFTELGFAFVQRIAIKALKNQE